MHTLIMKIKKMSWKQKLGIISGIIVLLCMVTIPLSFASLTPVRSVTITSQQLDYQSQEPGSWQIEKSAWWTDTGKARITFDLDTVAIEKNIAKDVIFVLDTSTSMTGRKINQVKEDTKELVESLLDNTNNRVALITFQTNATLVSAFTNDKAYILNEVENLAPAGSTNYYQGLRQVETILNQYEWSANRDVIVLFLTDGYPNVDVPNQITEYQYLKKNYPQLVINGVQYEMGDVILEPIQQISDNQFLADIQTLNNILFEASIASVSYDDFVITDYINDTYFEIDSIDSIQVSNGSYHLEWEENIPKVIWNVDRLRSGSSATMTIDVTLKAEYVNQGGTYPTNHKETIYSNIEEIEEDITSDKTPILAEEYKVMYEANAPEGCTVENVPANATYHVFSAVRISSVQPTCEGYVFKGWSIVTDGVQKISDTYFIMPESDVTLRAEWGKVNVAKSMDGTVSQVGDPIMKAYTASSTDDFYNSTYKSKITSIVTKNNMEIPTSGVIEDWDVSEARDGSVIAYIEDDGSGTGTYQLTIGGNGGIIANQNSVDLFYGFTNVQSMDLRYLDTSRMTNMYQMFANCTNLTTLNLTDFNTSNVSNMRNMFSDCTSLTALDLSHFDTANVTDMYSMFRNCNNLVTLNLSGLNTAKVTDMATMFYECTSLVNLNLSGLNTASVTDMRSMFYYCSSLVTLDISSFNTINVVDMSSMFSQCGQLTNLVFGEQFVTTNVTTMYAMFGYCRGLTQLDLRSFNTSKVTTMQSMFYDCRGLTSLNVSSFNTENVTTMRSMFYYCNSLTSLDVSSFNTAKVSDMQAMFSRCEQVRTLTLGDHFVTSNVSNMYNMFGYCRNLEQLDLSRFDTSKVTTMQSMFYLCESLTSLNVSNFNTSNVTNMASMFYRCSSLISLDLTSFNTAKVTTMSSMFSRCSSLQQLIASSNWVVSASTDITNMFEECGVSSVTII